MADIDLHIDSYLTLDFLKESIDSGIPINQEPQVRTVISIICKLKRCF